jgi:hypothetical protein
LTSLKDAELRIAAEIALEPGKSRGRQFDARATALTLCLAAMADAQYRARLAHIHGHLERRRAMPLRELKLVPIAPVFRDLERDAERILGSA